MKIAQVAPLIERVPPVAYGGTERVVCFLTEELVKQGHQVTLFASGDSVTTARLIPCCGKSLRLDKECNDPLAWHIIEMETVARMANDFDVIHYHVDYLHFPISTRLRTPSVTTLHGRLDLPELPFIHRLFPGMPLISISDAQRAPLPDLNWQTTIHHGLPDEWMQKDGRTQEHLLFLGRISPEKRADLAIEIAIRAGQRLVIAAKVDRIDREYFNEKVAPLLKHPLVDYIGEVNEEQKRSLLQKSRALLFPVDWPEPFGLVMIEAMACGVPVIAFRRGSVPEIIDDGVTGFIVSNVDEAVTAVNALDKIDRDGCRGIFWKRFRAKRMAEDYVAEFERLVNFHGFNPEDVRRSVA